MHNSTQALQNKSQLFQTFHNITKTLQHSTTLETHILTFFSTSVIHKKTLFSACGAHKKIERQINLFLCSIPLRKRFSGLVRIIAMFLHASRSQQQIV